MTEAGPSIEIVAKDALARLGQDLQLRNLEPQSFSAIQCNGNDYLGLLSNESYQQRLKSFCLELPSGSGSSRLLGGNHPIFAELEADFAAFKNAESALFLGSGYCANLAVMTVLAKLGCHFFSDQLNHASIIDGIQLSRGAGKTIFAHGRITDLTHVLEQSNHTHKVIVSESLFSMDGDIAALSELLALAQKHKALLVIDEAHGFGVFGPEGRGLAADDMLKYPGTITINPCGKALATQGAIVTGPKWFIELLVNWGRPFIYSTAPSPWLAAAALFSIRHIRELEESRKGLRKISRKFRDACKGLGYQIGLSESQIVPIILGDNARTIACSDHLYTRGIKASPIRVPTVPAGSARLRISLTAGHTEHDINQIVTALASFNHAH